MQKEIKYETEIKFRAVTSTIAYYMIKESEELRIKIKILIFHIIDLWILKVTFGNMFVN